MVWITSDVISLCEGSNLLLFYIQTLKQELSSTRAYKEVSAKEHSVVNDHCSHSPIKFPVNVKDRQDKLPTMYW